MKEEPGLDRTFYWKTKNRRREIYNEACALRSCFFLQRYSWWRLCHFEFQIIFNQSIIHQLEDFRILNVYRTFKESFLWTNKKTRMHSSRMRTARSLTVSRSICHACPPAMNIPHHAHPLQCMPPAMQAPTTHAPAPPATHAPCHACLHHACALPHMPPHHACHPPCTDRHL